MIIEPATAAHVARYFSTRKVPAPAQLYAGLIVQVTSSPAWAAIDGDLVICLGGVWRWHDERPGEAWLMTDGLASSSILRLARVFRRIIAEQGAQGPILTRWRTDNTAGARLARLAGLTEQVSNGASSHRAVQEDHRARG